ncbi:OPT oligopeptide transporter [Dichomitus squalens]|uniref:OPT oligopeptide transporter n=1 Tax=Dichomitus squalens TaxID=114155 RepID=A0A4Q9N5U8_9APHY|nr:OPT oligopeptide transporter [Dichomitus squalens]TBU43595.1 OPT oligopeptide transporter [Dichomitus squalens]TBU65463.1 OPT oligopeptide transporter [Dichomitus squalens]
MAEVPSVVPTLDDKHSASDASLEKKGLDGADVSDDAIMAKEVEEFEERLQRDEAEPEEYLVQEAYEVAIKVLTTHDDPELKSVTFRTAFLGVGFSAFGAVLAQIYYFKPQTILVSQLFLLILSYWFGTAMATLLPSRGLFRWINPGPFNIKEHVAIIIMSSSAAVSATAIQVISVQDLYYNRKLNGGLAIFTLIGSQLLGYGYAGLLHDMLVKPTKAFWPSTISTANLFQALHYDNQMTSKRVRLFWTIFVVMFFWEIIPQWIFPLLTGISIFCLANNHSTVFRNIFGGASNNEGMGLLSWCFDWNLIGSDCLFNPLWLQINQDIGIFLTYILMAGVYYGNLWRAKDFPFMSQAIFAADGSQYNQTALLTNGKFDAEKYAELGPAFFSATNALYYMTSNLSLGATFTHVFFWHWQDIKPFLKTFNPWNKEPLVVHDPHYEKMKVYKPVPRWWFLLILVAAYAIAQATNYSAHSGLPWWAVTVVLIISLIMSMLFATLAATIGFNEFSTSANGFYQMIVAYLVPGNPVANMYGALYGQHPQGQCILMLKDLKLGQYVKLAPRVTFAMQIIGTVVGAILNYVMMQTIIDNNRADLLSVSGTRLWSGQNAQSFNTNGISWGGLAPQMFGINGVYHMVPICLAIGVFLPLPFIIAYYIWPKAGFENFNTPIILQYSCFLSVGINTSVNPSMVIGIFSQWWVRTRYPRWFTKYNYIVAAALDGGTQVISFILNFAVFGASGTAHNFPQWWGNDFNLSADRCALPDQ